MSSRLLARTSLALVMMLVLSMVMTSLVPVGSFAQGTPEAEVAEDSDAFMPGNGLSSALIGQADVDLGMMGDPTLRLERIDLPVGSVLPTHTATVNEILYVEAGAVAIADGFGFTTETVAGQQWVFNPGTSYDLQQAGDTAATVLRVRVAGINEPPLDTTATEAESGPAGATPVVSEPTITTIIDHRLTDAPSLMATYYLARVDFAPGAESGEQSHNGPLGIYVANGALTALSPSGATGTLNTGASAVLPTNVPLIASNQGNDDTVVYLVGIGTQGGSLLVEITPTPIPTIPPTPTPTPEPTPTTPPTPTIEPSPTVPPTPTIEPSPTVPPTPTPTPEPTIPPTPRPTATPVPTTPMGMTLPIGQSWVSDAASVTSSVSVDNRGDILIEFNYRNRSDTRADFPTDVWTVFVHDDLGWGWSVMNSNRDLPARVIVEPGQEVSYARKFESPERTNYAAEVFVVVQGIEGLQLGQWAFTYNRGEILRSPYADTRVQVGPSRHDLSTILPSISEAPSPLTQFTQRWRPLQEVASAYSSPSALMDTYLANGWAGSILGSYFPEGGYQRAARSEINTINVSLHEFDGATGADAALELLLSDIYIDGWSYVSEYPAGTGVATVLSIVADRSNDSDLARVVVSQSGVLVIVTVWSVEGDTINTAINITNLILSKLGANSSVDVPVAMSATTSIMSLVDLTLGSSIGLIQTSIQTRTLPEVIEYYTDPDGTSTQFTAWGWQGNAIASFGPPGGSAADGTVNGVYASIHQFGSPEFAQAALDFSLTEQSAGTPLQEVQSRPFGEYTRALYGPLDYGNEITLLTQQGDLLIRVSASMVGGNPTNEAEAIMEAILLKVSSAGDNRSEPNGATINSTTSFPASFVGSWQGTGQQQNPSVEWPITITLSGGDVGQVVGTTSYPSYPCGGNLVLVSYTESTAEFTEHLTYGADACADAGTITLTLTSANQVSFWWGGIGSNGTWSTATATLYRE